MNHLLHAHIKNDNLLVIDTGCQLREMSIWVQSPLHKHTITDTRAQLMCRNQRCKGSIFSFYELLSIRVPGPYTTWRPWLDYFRFYYEIKWILVPFQARYKKSFHVKPQFSRRGLSFRVDKKRGNQMKITSTTCRTNGSYVMETWTPNSVFYGTFTWGTHSITD